jgi:hypothetical protein
MELVAAIIFLSGASCSGHSHVAIVFGYFRHFLHCSPLRVDFRFEYHYIAQVSATVAADITRRQLANVHATFSESRCNSKFAFIIPIEA